MKNKLFNVIVALTVAFHCRFILATVQKTKQ